MKSLTSAVATFRQSSVAGNRKLAMLLQIPILVFAGVFGGLAVSSSAQTSPPAKKEERGVQEGDSITHRFLACGQQTYIVENDGSKSWSYPHATRDGYVLADGRIVLTLSKSAKHAGGAVVIVAKDGAETVLWKGTQSEVNSTHPTPSGTFVITEAGPKPRLIELDAAGQVIVEFPLQCQLENHHMQTRMARKLDDGTYLVPHLFDFAILHYDAQGKVLSRLATRLFDEADRKVDSWPFTAIRHSKDHTLVCLTHGNRVAEFDGHGKLVWLLTNEDFEEPWLQDPCGGQLLPNGNRVIASYAAGRTNVQFPKLIEVTREKKVVWTYSNQEKVGIHHFQILDTNGQALPLPVLK